MPNLSLFARVFLAIVATTAFAAPPANAQQLKATDRIVFIGDSITGQGGNNATGGWVALIGEGLKAAHPDAAQTLVALGGSGQTVGSWAGIEKNSRTTSQTLDVKKYDVKTELDTPADAIVVMLGMNDVLSPSLKDTPADIEKWATTYEALVQALKARTGAKIVGVATVTPCTEDPKSAKNRVLAKLNEQIARIAKADGFALLPTNETAWSIQAEGRTWNSQFHITNDTVHPSGPGHLAIAMGMLTGLGEPIAAKYLRDGKLAQEYVRAAGALPILVTQIAATSIAANPDRKDVVIRYWWHGATGATDAPTVHLASPEGFSAAKDLHTPQGEFRTAGVCDHLTTAFTVTATAGAASKTSTATLPASWIAGITPSVMAGWTVRNPWTFDPAVGAVPIDEKLATGVGFGDSAIMSGTTPIEWTRFTPSNEYVGGADPNSIDFSGVGFFSSFSTGYAARWIYSPKERAVKLSFASSGWGGSDHLQVWVNGASAYAGHFGRVPKEQAVAETKLKAGWNSLVLKSAHLQWLWQVSVGVSPLAGDDLADLRYATVAPK
ncbi:MAG TPA: GDSL-type esterase/lipase family protein [Capsulimonadaceae bacterium]|jgi:lysophospholipase L1-like esterase